MNTFEETLKTHPELAAEGRVTDTVREVLKAEAAPAGAPGRLTLSPQDRTRVMGAVAFHVNGHVIPKANPTGGVRLFQRIHGEMFLNNFFEHNMQTINTLGQLPEFSFFRTIHDDLIGKKITALLVNGLLVSGYLGVNGYNGEAFDLEKPIGFNYEDGLTYVRPTPVFYTQFKTDAEDTKPRVLEEIPFISIVAVNDRLPVDSISVPVQSEYEAYSVPLVDDVERNSKEIAKHREEVIARKEHDILAEKRRKKNLAQRKARRANRK